MELLKISVLFFAILAVGFAAYSVKQPKIEALSPKGVKFTYAKDDPNLSLVAFHFNINKPLSGVAASDFGDDVTSLTDGAFVYIQPDIQLNIGDKVYYWVYALNNGVGYVLTDQVWTNEVTTSTAKASTTTKSTTTTKPTTTTTKSTTSGGSTISTPDCSQCPCENKGEEVPKCTSYPCLIFEDEFDKFDLNTWEHEITAGGGGNWEFQYYTNNRTNSYVKNGILHLKPTLTEEKYGKDMVTKAGTVLELWGSEPANLCTGNQWWGCRRETYLPNIINPIQSARIRTVNSFSFRYGRLEVEAKLPRGDWIWPAIWLLPRYQAYGGWPASGEIDLMESRGNTGLYNGGVHVGLNQVGFTQHYGPYWPMNGWEYAHEDYNLPNGESFNDAFHKFTLDWDKDGLTYSLDGQEILHVPTDDGYWKKGQFDKKLPDDNNVWRYDSLDAPFNQEFYIIMNVAVGGTGGFFPDSLTNDGYPKPWSDQSPQAALDFWNAKDRWFPTWPQGETEDDRAMQIKSVKVWKMTAEQDEDF